MCAKYREEKHIKYCLASALLELMENYPFDEITVNEICYTAHVGRATFYNYASGKRGKDDLLIFKVERDFDQYVADRRIKGLTKSDADGGDTFNFIFDNRDTFRLLHKNQLSNVLIHFLRHAEGNPESTGDQAYIDSYLALGYLGIMEQWYREDYSKSALDVAYIIFNKHADLVKWHIQRYLETNQN